MILAPHCLPKRGILVACLLLFLAAQTAQLHGQDNLPLPPTIYPPLKTEVMVPWLADGPPAQSPPTEATADANRIIDNASASGIADEKGPTTQAPSSDEASKADQALDADTAVPTIASAPAEPIEPPPLITLDVMLEWYPNPRHASLFLARDKGLFSRRGLEVRLLTPADPTVSTKLLAAGRVDLALSRQPLLHLEVAAGEPLIRVATLIDMPLSALVLREDGSLDSLIDLAGRRIGHSDDDSLKVMLDTMLKPLGISRSEIEIHDVNFSPARAMLEDELDGVIGAMRHRLPRELGDQGLATRVLNVEDHGVPLHDGLVLLANRDRLKDQRVAIRALVDALEEITAWIIENPDDAWERLVASEPDIDTPANHANWGYVLTQLSGTPAALDHGRYARFATFLHEGGVVDELIPVERLAVDPGTF
ncbi:ABC transporter substrate-binding protein [Halomonas sp.]|uniref:ABC transporter substrate-binding protein n=1 Tax=Halomonas sp. TaxID=1486246 RepID=UPI00356159DA